ncbi:MAG TPA: hypothetical protein VHD81_12150 [Mycobacteriales bacterium]|nr:hypothetical protein [Mycobacteriales bacterium]
MALVRRLPGSVAALALVALTGCASTIQVQEPTSGVVPPAAVGGDGLSLTPAPDDQSSGQPAQAGTSPTMPASRPSSLHSSPRSGGSSSPSRSSRPSASMSTSAIPAAGPGWDAKHVYLGITTASDAAGTIHALGISLDPGDEIADAKAIVAAMNRQGGLFGRQVVLIVKDDSSAHVLSDPAGAAQADCVFFTQDHRVISVVNTDATIDLDSFRSCFARAHVPLVSTTTAPFDDTTQRSFAPYFYNTLSVSLTRLIPVLIDRLTAQHYFGGWNSLAGKPGTNPVKVGVLFPTGPTGGRIGAALLGALKQAGIASDHYEYSSATDTAAASAAVFRFKADHVTHVIGVDTFQYFFGVAANTQGFYPRYGVTTYSAPETLLRANGPPRQMAGAMGLGWIPSIDTDAQRDPGPGPGTKQCLAELAAGAQHFAGHRFAEAVGLAICDGLQLGVRGAKSGNGLDPASIRSGIVALGRKYPMAAGFVSGLSETNFALPGGGRDLAWNPGCRCFAYHGSTFPI